jgi:hypothetical protein
LVNFCIRKHIDLILLPPHSSHLLQPLDVAIFGPLKWAISIQISHLLRSGIVRIQKAEWLERYIEARDQAITKGNILTGWCGAGLFPENMHRILQQIPDSKALPTTPVPLSVAANHTLYFPTSSPPDPATLQSTNQAFLAEISVGYITQYAKSKTRDLFSSFFASFLPA